MQATHSPRTFHKRLCRTPVLLSTAGEREHLDVRSAPQDLDWHRLADVLPRLHEQLCALVTLNEQGMTQPRRKRRANARR